MKLDFEIRPANFQDLPDIARVHVESWQQTYAGLVPQHFLDNLNISERQKKWEENFLRKTVEDSNLYVACDHGDVIGFVSFGRPRDESMKSWGEIYAIYLLKPFWGKGIGFKLFQTARRELVSQDFKEAYLWVLDTNKNALFAYQKWGCKIHEETVNSHSIGGQDVGENLVTFSLI